MCQRGYSLVELLVTMGIVAILLSIATMEFGKWNKRVGMERQIKELYADLMGLRQDAMVTKQAHRVQFSASSYVFRRYSTEFDATGVVTMQKAVKYPITLSNWASPSTTEIEFNSRGIMVDPIGKCICTYSTIQPPMDSIVISQSRINIGRIINQGGACARTNIEIK